MRQRLLDLIATTSAKHISQRVNRDPDLCAFVFEQTAALPQDVTLAERIYCVIHGIEVRHCANGNTKKFNTLAAGYRFCAPDCDCRREEQRRKMTAHHAALPEEERSRRVDKQRETLLERHGVTNAMHLEAAKEALKATNRARYGSDYFVTSEEGQAKFTATNLDRYGVEYPFQAKEIRQKAGATHLARYGVEHDMGRARAAFSEHNLGRNPFQIEEIAEKARHTMLARHGVERALQSPVILLSMQERLVEKYGVKNVMHDQNVKKTMRDNNLERYGREYVNQSHIAPETLHLLRSDKAAFERYIEGKHLRQMAEDLGVSYKTVQRAYENYGIPIPKSSYEKALLGFLYGLGFSAEDVLVGKRTIIKPFEIDLFIKSKGIGIEFGGLYTHREDVRDADYHLLKHVMMAETGHRLITIFEDEMIESPDIVYARLRHLLGCSDRGEPARKVVIKEIKAGEARTFLDMHHIQGEAHGRCKLGAFNENGELVGVMVFSKPRNIFGRPLPTVSGHYELLRFATDGKSHPGLASKLMSHFVKHYDPVEIISYADRRWSEGGLYRALGFEELPASKPGYWYIPKNQIRREHRYQHRRAMLLKRWPEYAGTKVTEQEIMAAKGYQRIWDCGQLVFRWRK